jgi:hypothetical protein
MAPLILNLDTTGRIHVPAALPPGETASGGHWIGDSVAPTGNQTPIPQPGSLVTIPTELSRL